MKDSHFIKENGAWNLTSDAIKIVEFKIIKRILKVKDINDIYLNLRDINKLKKCIIAHCEYNAYENSL